VPEKSRRAALSDARFNLENTVSEDFRVQLAARYLAFDIGGSGSELRIDGIIGSDPLSAQSGSGRWEGGTVRAPVCRRDQVFF
jgi:hypothetical protein